MTKPVQSFNMPPLVFGGNVFGWTADKSTSFRLLDALLERGLNYIDSANVYSYWADGNSGGESETIIGLWMKERKNRDRMIIATKGGSPMGSGSPNLSKTYLSEQIDLSLKRLQTDYIDIYYSHKYDSTVSQEETLGAYHQAIYAGKLKEIGASNFPLQALNEAINLSENLGLPRYKFIQPEYNLMERDMFEGAYRKFCLDNNLIVNSYFTLASGFLTGKYETEKDTAGKERQRFVKKYFSARGQMVLDILKRIAHKYGVSVAGVSIAWTMAQPGISAPIISASTVSQLQAFDEALELNLDHEDLQQLNEVSLKNNSVI